MKSYNHARSSVKRWKGEISDYLPIHEFIDSSKVNIVDVRHRSLLHSAWGIFLVEKMYGTVITNSSGKVVCTRDIAEHHIFEDMGFIPSAEHWLKNMTIQPWMHGKNKKTKPKFIKFKEN